MSDIRRILALDIGKKRVGMAVSDPLRQFAVGLETLEITGKKDLLAGVLAVASEYPLERLVLGLPLHMNGTEGPEAARVRELARLLGEATGLPISFLDERLTSVLAQQTLHAQGIQPSRNKGLVDQAAAKRILQDYLDRNPAG